MEFKKAVEKIKREFGKNTKIMELDEPSNYYPSGWGYNNAKRKLEKKYKTKNNQKIIIKHKENNRFWWFLIEK